MNPTIILGIELLITLIERLEPHISAAIKAGTIDLQTQAKYAAASAAIRALIVQDPETGRPKFIGPEWEQGK